MALPFITWPGGKTRLLKELIPRMPRDFKKYWEPFLGGGALFFKVRPKEAVLSDANAELINCYDAIKSDPEAVIRSLKMVQYQRDTHPERFFRQVYDDYLPSGIYNQAARYIFISKHCSRGLIKRGSTCQLLGQSYRKHNFFNEEKIRRCGKALKNATVVKWPYRLINPQEGDFVYFDPPYYSTDDVYSDNFTEKDHIRLRNICNALDVKGVKFMLSNSWNKETREWYKDFNCISIGVNYGMKAGLQKGASQELLVRNY